MASSQSFRSAFNGFNREDVVSYIEYVNTRHSNQVSQLRSELQNAEDALQKLQEKSQTAVPSEELQKLQEKCASLEAENTRLTAENAQLLQEKTELEDLFTSQDSDELTQLKAQVEQLTRERDEAAGRAAKAQDIAQQELEAYRRAERTEREARERVAQLYDGAAGIFAQAQSNIGEASEDLNALAAQTAQHLEKLQAAVARSRDILSDTAVQISALRADEN